MGSVVADVGRVLATLRPFGRDSKCFANLFRGSLCDSLDPEITIHGTSFLDATLTAARPRRRALNNRIDERTPCLFV